MPVGSTTSARSPKERHPPRPAERDLATTAQDLDWTFENKLDTINADGIKTTYVYDADGNRVLENSPSGSTLYLGETELTTNSSGTITRAARAYVHPGAPTAVRTTTNGATTGHKLTVLLADHLGTASTTVDLADGQTVIRRAFKPYGEVRGPKPSTWPNRRSYLGVGIDDAATGLTHIGAREYDQASGRFLSADPVVDISDPLQMSGYTCSNNSPISKSDPTGLMYMYEGQGSRTTSSNDSGDTRKGRDGKEIAADRTRHNAAVAAVAIYLRFLWRANPDAQVKTEYHIPGAGLEKETGGFADIVVIFPDYIYVWEMKSAKTAELDGPKTLDRYINALRKIERKEGTFRTVERGNNLPHITTLDPLDPKKQLVAESTQQ